jgi:pyruvate-formate lyase
MEPWVTEQTLETSPNKLALGSELRSRSERVNRLYSRLQERMTRKQQRWGADLTVLNDPKTAQLPFVLRRAKAVEKILLEMPIIIEDDDFIVGNTVAEGSIVRPGLPHYATEAEQALAEEEGSIIREGLAHKTPYYPRILEKGLAGIIDEIVAKITALAGRQHSRVRDEKLALFEAMRLECEAVIALANRYADLAQKLSTRASSVARRDELIQIAEVCRRVPEFPASSFHEAVQAFWFIHYALFATETLIACGRLDQYLYPFFKKDVMDGRITLEEAQEIVDCLWLRFNDRAQIIRENFYPNCSCEGGERNDTPDAQGKHEFSSGTIIGTAPRMMRAGHRERCFYADERADAINHLGQNILLSGIRPDGSDGTNALTYICLNAMEKFALVSPVVTVRLHQKSPRALISRTAEVLTKGGGQPFINNDEVIIQGYVDLGVPLEDARDYANSNCWETMIQGKSDQELIRGINFLLYLELALNRGVSRVNGETLGLDTGDPRDFQTFKELMDAWKAQTDYQLAQAIEYIGHNLEEGTLEHSGHGQYCYNPLLSALTLDCIDKEKDVTRGGARYVIWHLMGEALANTIDALAAIKKTVFEEKTVTMDDLLTSLESDWKGHETLRQRLVATSPRFSRDDDYADDIGREMMDFFLERARIHATRHPTILFPRGVGTFSWIVMSGREVGATPDGRRFGEAVAVNLSPAVGADVLGPTAAIRSYVKMRVAGLPAGAPIDLRFTGSSLQDQAGVQRLAGFIKAFLELGGNMITLTVTDVEELKRAMKEPEKYRHLRVRMGGWTAYFVMLSREQQLMHIQRVEHGLA